MHTKDWTKQQIRQTYNKPVLPALHLDANLALCEKLQDFRFHILLPGSGITLLKILRSASSIHGSEGVKMS